MTQSVGARTSVGLRLSGPKRAMDLEQIAEIFSFRFLLSLPLGTIRNQ